MCARARSGDIRNIFQSQIQKEKWIKLLVNLSITFIFWITNA